MNWAVTMWMLIFLALGVGIGAYGVGIFVDPEKRVREAKRKGYREAAPEVKEIGEELIEKYHGNLQGEARIAYIFRDPPIKKKGDEMKKEDSKYQAAGNSV